MMLAKSQMSPLLAFTVKRMTTNGYVVLVSFVLSIYCGIIGLIAHVYTSSVTPYTDHLTIRRTYSPTTTVWSCITVTNSQRGSASLSWFAKTRHLPAPSRPAMYFYENYVV